MGSIPLILSIHLEMRTMLDNYLLLIAWIFTLESKPNFVGFMKENRVHRAVLGLSCRQSASGELFKYVLKIKKENVSTERFFFM